MRSCPASPKCWPTAPPWWSNLPDLEDRVRAFVEREGGLRRPPRDGDRLLEDIGVDGDDAVELFDAFATEFAVDLEPLHHRWADHFGPEGFPLAAGLGLVVVGLIVSLPLGIFTALPKWAVIGLSMAAAFGWLFGLGAWPLRFGKVTTPITVGDLIAAARAGRWPETAG